MSENSREKISKYNGLNMKKAVSRENSIICFVNKIERQSIVFIFSTNPGFPHFYYTLGANLVLLLYGEVSMISNI